ncbi:hypothetical protein HKX42_10300 [Salinisphaera sp. USBA-960]|nr:hypothetical protein [Salifodinibacter halophilus]NNC27264.1 hypothetical protein [Salifodinibacter halophilus]
MDTINTESLPQDLVQRDNWLLWRQESSGKVPYQAQAPQVRANPTDHSTWASFDATRSAYHPQRDAGIGFALDGEVAAVDIDGDTSSKAVDLLHEVGCGYIELSPSGNGLHGWGLFDGELPRKKVVVDGISVEIYNSSRYMSVTGNTICHGQLLPLSGIEKIYHPPATQVSTSHPKSNARQSNSGTRQYPRCEILRFLPPETGKRNEYLYKLARHLKACYPERRAKDMLDIVQQWFEQAKPYIATQDFMESWSDFTRAWETIQFSEGEGIESLLVDVESDPDVAGVPPVFTSHAMFLAKVCRRLQNHSGDEPFYLSARKAGELLGIHWTNAARQLNGLVSVDVLQLVEKGTKTSRKARTYWFLAESERNEAS